ncbi:hypothetical protein D3C81_1277710 [compost metagenome]
MDQVGQQHSGARFAAPRDLEIAVGFAQLEQRSDRGQTPECPALHQFMGPHDQRVVAPMMADQYRHAAAFDRRNQFAHFIQVHADRFFQQHRHTRRQTIERRADVLIIRIGDDHRVWPDLLQHLTMISEMPYAPFGRKPCCLRPRIRHRTQRCFVEGL